MLPLSLVSIKHLAPIYLLTVTLFVALIWRPPARRRVLGLAATIGAAAGAFVSWWLGDVLDVVGVPPTWVDRIWVSAIAAVIAVAGVMVVRGGWVKRVLAIVSVFAVVSAGALAINRDAGLFPTVGSALGVSSVPRIQLEPLATDTPHPFDPVLYRSWHAPADLPARGRVGSIRIPGIHSGFKARPAIVYLPPAALVAHAPALPVVIMMSGQGPGASPDNVVDAGHLVHALNGIAAAHHGLAPIVVIPDQLAFAANNPMCVDGPLGNSYTYLTRDVPDWIRSHLTVERDPAAWAVAGFSQGGTCSIQLAARRPDLFGSFLDVSGELGPTLATKADTVERGFSGSEAAYEAAQPRALLKSHGPYPATNAFLAGGGDDPRFGPDLPLLATAAREAGMRVTTDVPSEGGHDWVTASGLLRDGFDWLMPRVGLAEATTAP